MSDEWVRLHRDQSAAPQTCGSCALFTRARTEPQFGTTRGNCGLRFPPWMKLRHTHARTPERGGACEVFENSSDVTLVYDADTCSFWRQSGLTYVKDQVWSITGDGK